MSENERDDRGTLRIGAVARLTGIGVHTLRKWEERYGAVQPRRTEGGERIYTPTDLERLRLIKRLADAGLSLPKIAPLSLAELSASWQELTSATGGATKHSPVRVAVLGSAVAASLATAVGGLGVLELVASAAEPGELEFALGQRPVDVLLYECPAVGRETARKVHELRDRLRARAVVVVYGFAARADLLSLQSPTVATLRAPVDARAVEQAALALIHPDAALPRGAMSATGLEPDADIAPPRLSRELIARVVRSSPRMRCECPHHLADLVLSLRAFEDYSAACESANAEDAALHHYLWRSAAMARAMFEDAIEHVAAAEGIDLGE